MLKTAMQNQLDGARVGLKQLEACLEDIKEANFRYIFRIIILNSQF